MGESDPAAPPDGPSREALLPAFEVTEIEVTDGGQLRYFGQPRTEYRRLEQQLWPVFREHGYEVRLDVIEEAEADPITGVDVTRTRQALVATPHSVGVDGVPWTPSTPTLCGVATSAWRVRVTSTPVIGSASASSMTSSLTS